MFSSLPLARWQNLFAVDDDFNAVASHLAVIFDFAPWLSWPKAAAIDTAMGWRNSFRAGGVFQRSPAVLFSIDGRYLENAFVRVPVLEYDGADSVERFKVVAALN